MISIKAAKHAGVPLVVVETADATQTIQTIIKELSASKYIDGPILQWDFCRGVTALNKPGEALITTMLQGSQSKAATQTPQALVQFLANTPEMKPEKGGPDKGKEIRQVVVFMHNAHRFWNDGMVMQGIWNLRDHYETIGAMLIMLCQSSTALPPELRADTVVLTDTLPDKTEIAELTDTIVKAAGLVPSSIEDKAHIHDTLLGLPAFSARQVLAMSINGDGIDRNGLWERKIRTVEQTRGLTVHRGKEKYCDVGGLANAKQILSKTIIGKTSIRAVVFLDELDKGMAASRTDTSGTTQDQLKCLLTYMQDNDVLGILFNGPPGSGKTVLAKAAANEHDILNIALDLGAMKGQYVGESEKSLREAIKVIHAITDGKALFIGACNRSDTLPPELRRRFNYASVFFDLPDAMEREAMWKIWRAKFGLLAKQCDSVADDNWTGAEVRNCCLKAWAMNCSLSEAAKSIVPVAVSAKDEIENLRAAANGKYIHASREGLYIKPSNYDSKTQQTSRKMERA